MRSLLLPFVLLFVSCGPVGIDQDGGTSGGGAAGGRSGGGSGGSGGGTTGGGAAGCTGGLSLCAGACRNLFTDPGFCGGCTTFCSGGEICVGGFCRLDPMAGGSAGGGTATGGGGGAAAGGGAVTGGGGGSATGGGTVVGGGTVTGGGGGSATGGGTVVGGGGGSATGGGTVVGGGGSATGGGTGGGGGGGSATGGGAGGGGATGGGTGVGGGSTAGGSPAGGSAAGGSTAGGSAGGMTAGGSAGGSASVCGNGVVQSGEQCDDGNVITTDGCASCQISIGYTCVGSPSVCTTTLVRINNGTSFPLVSAVIDGVERIPARNSMNQCFGYAPGTYAEFPVTPNMTHTWRAANGGVTDNITCNDLVHESWGPLTFNRGPGLYEVTLTNRAMEAYINGDFGGYSYSCWEATYNDSSNNTRIARLRLNNGGTFSFREVYNLGGAVTRSGSGTWAELSRTIGFSFNYRFTFTGGFWDAQWDRGGGNYITNGVSAAPRILYLRQTNGLNGPPINCPP